MASGSPKPMWVSHTAVVRARQVEVGEQRERLAEHVRWAPPVNSCSSGTSDIWIGTASSATTLMNSQSRPGKSIQAKA